MFVSIILSQNHGISESLMNSTNADSDSDILISISLLNTVHYKESCSFINLYDLSRVPSNVKAYFDLYYIYIWNRTISHFLIGISILSKYGLSVFVFSVAFQDYNY